jgi:hypothetical protein
MVLMAVDGLRLAVAVAFMVLATIAIMPKLSQL